MLLRWHIGTMGFSYDDWSGVFYPPGLTPGEYLSFYARHFDTVELDTTFYATPPVDRVRKWASAVPPGFRFCLKAPRQITHEGLMNQPADTLRAFLDVARELGEKLAVVLLQFPPSLQNSAYSDVRRLIESVPDDVRFAAEFRHRSWGEARTLAMLREHRVALAWAEYLTRPAALPATTDFAYVRLIGEHNRFPHHRDELVDMTEGLNWWREKLPAVTGIHDAFVVVNNDYSGNSVLAARKLHQLLGLAVPEWSDQPGLFT